MSTPQAKAALQIVTVGNPNVGKSSLINALSGSDLKVGNWPGSTVQRLEVFAQWEDRAIHLVDLPGCYSLLGASAEETICREELLRKSPDLILNVIDATNLRRNLSLTLELLELKVPLIVVLNLWDEFLKRGGGLDIDLLSQRLGVPIVTTSARSGSGTSSLRHLIAHWESPEDQCNDRTRGSSIVYSERLAQSLLQLEADGVCRWQALLLLGLDQAAIEANQDLKLFNSPQNLKHRSSWCDDHEAYFEICEARLHHLNALVNGTDDSEPQAAQGSTIDKIILNRWLGLPIFLASMLVLFRFTFLFSQPWVTFLNELKGVLISWLMGFALPDGLKNFLAHGLLDGLGTVAAFIPVLFILYSYMGFLESSGYLARVTFVFDRIMAALRLPGRALIPLLLGFGCNVAAVYATRTLEEPRDRLRVALATPFMSCSARLAVFVLFGAIFFPQNGSWIIFGLYLLGLFLGLATTVLLGALVPHIKTTPAIMELPPYRIPSALFVAKMAWRQVRSFLEGAALPIVVTVMVIWALSSFPNGPREQSYYGLLGRAIATILGPIGITDWRLAGALVPGFIAKEVVIGTLAVSYLGTEAEPALTFGAGIIQIGLSFKTACWETLKAVPELFGLPSFVSETDASTDLQKAIALSASRASALAYLVYVLIYTPCVATLVAIRQEFGTRWAAFSLIYQLAVAYLAAFMVYHLALHFYP